VSLASRNRCDDDLGSSGAALGMQSQAIGDCQLTASESPIAAQQPKHARLGGPSGTRAWCCKISCNFVGLKYFMNYRKMGFCVVFLKVL